MSARLVIAIAVLALATQARAQHHDHAPPPATGPAVDPHAGHVMPAPAAKPKPKPKPAPAPAKAKAAAVDPHAGHVMPAPKPKPKPKPKAKPKPAPAKAAAAADPHAGHVMPATPPAQDPHAGHAMPATPPAQDPHAGHVMPTTPPAQDPHAGHEMPATPPAQDPHAGHVMPTTPPAQDPHAGHAMPATPPAQDPHAHHAPAAVEPVPALTDADRAAAFPVLTTGHDHGRGWNSYVLVDRLEAWHDGDETGEGWEVEGWLGGDVNRLWLRAEGEHGGGDSEVALELLYGRGISAWWDVVAGVRHEHGEDPAHTWLAVGVQGLAPYKIETKATAYVDRRGRLAARVAAEYETLLSSRWILQWEASVEAHGRRDLRDEQGTTASGIGPAHVPDDGYGRHGAGISTVAAGARLRYEINRRFAPYIGIERERAYGGTADLRRAAGESIDDTRVVVGVRFWF